MENNNEINQKPNDVNVDINKKNDSSEKKNSINSYVKKYSSTIRSLVKDEIDKPQEERSKDLKALIFTIIIISILVFIFWKVPVLHNFLFP